MIMSDANKMEQLGEGKMPDISVEQLNKQYGKVYRTFNSQLHIVNKIDPKDYLWIVQPKNEKSIVDYIETRKTDNTKKAYYNAFACAYKYYSNFSNHHKNKKLGKTQESKYQKYIKLATDLGVKHNKEVIEPQTKSAKFVDQSDIVAIRDDWGNKFNADTSNNKTNMIHLVLCLNTYLPSMRSQIYSLPVLKKKLKKPTYNYAYKDESDKLWHINITQKQKGRPNDLDISCGKELSCIIDKSMDAYPRKFLVGSWMKSKEPIKSATIGKELKKLNLGIQVMRTSSASAFLDSNPSNIERKEHADKMLHSVATEQTVYHKRDKLPIVFETKHSRQIPAMSKADIANVVLDTIKNMSVTQKQILVKPKADLTDIERAQIKTEKERIRKAKYRSQNKELINDKARKYVDSNPHVKLHKKITAYLWQINSGKTRNPTQAKLNEYNIVKIDGVYKVKE